MSTSALLSLVLLASLFCLGRSSYAVYTLTQGTPNQVSIFSGDSNGVLSYSGRVDTGGNGVPTGSPRGLESQNPIIVFGSYIFAVNTGSNTVSMLSIDPMDATKVTLINNQPSGGDWPLSVTAYDKYVCVANSGVINGIRCFTYTSSGLSVLANSDRSTSLTLTTPPVFHTGPAQVQFVPDGSGIVVSIKSRNPPLLLWKFTAGVLAATPVATSEEGNVPFGFEFDSDNITILLTDPDPFNIGVSGVGQIKINSVAPSASFFGNFTLIPNQLAACWITRSAGNGHFYVANSATHDISEISRDVYTNVITVVKDYTLNASISPTDMAVATVAGTEYLFAQSKGSQLLVMSLAGGVANAKLTQTVDLMPTSNYGGGVAAFVAQSSLPTTPPSTTSSSPILSAASSVFFAALIAVFFQL